ncbi:MULTISPECIES: hypothetical protein [unclassified Corynebacterium]|uniref:hypothetical protein n=1 Tax=unclassified Corynebacterium TaxID=2624378 RepID=UPI0008A61D95|nr:MULTISPECIES: hypothetical protein [unclassified Corynebacterium]OFK68467.1 hypothetical protein HMPREF2806_06740 [Corynebacterium sp. HMSC076G08]OFN36134.1 hypothetical protein HMPREF2565_00795 [Corynebacterium sp. HMSC072A04]OFP31699.1 hypothetical protein HMPREF2993_00555 [Corynebacterium sp. HMSC068G04]OHO56028.1 hypothetical protein HMPREF2635_04000 [Corynebacterium sp. HMSC035E02]
MKFFSRKALVAAATAATVSLSGVSVASAEDTAVVTNESADSESTTDNNKETDNSESENDKEKEEESSSSSSNDSEGSSITDMKPSEIRDWIAVFTAIIGALGTVFAFYQKNFAPNAK